MTQVDELIENLSRARVMEMPYETLVEQYLTLGFMRKDDMKDLARKDRASQLKLDQLELAHKKLEERIHTQDVQLKAEKDVVSGLHTRIEQLERQNSILTAQLEIRTEHCEGVKKRMSDMIDEGWISPDSFAAEKFADRIRAEYIGPMKALQQELAVTKEENSKLLDNYRDVLKTHRPIVEMKSVDTETVREIKPILRKRPSGRVVIFRSRVKTIVFRDWGMQTEPNSEGTPCQTEQELPAPNPWETYREVFKIDHRDSLSEEDKRIVDSVIKTTVIDKESQIKHKNLIFDVLVDLGEVTSYGQRVTQLLKSFLVTVPSPWQGGSISGIRLRSS